MIDHHRLAARLRRAYAGPVIEPIRHAEPGATMDDAYRIQACNTAHWLKAGRRIVGAKIGLTSQAVQQQLGVDQPDFGVLFDDMQVGEDNSIPAGRLLQPKAEAEVAFVLASDLGAVGDDIAAVGRAIAHALPAIEIVDSRIANWDIGMIDTIADNASSGMFVLGSAPVELAALDLTGCAMRMTRNGNVASTGSGAACMGNPLLAVAWLANMRASLGAPLRAGEIILSGALGPMVEATPGDAFHAEIAGLGEVEVRFAMDSGG